MGAEIEWHTSQRAGAIRYGPKFKSAAQRDPYIGHVDIRDMGDGLAVLGPASGKMRIADYGAILEACARHGFRCAQMERCGCLFEVDLTERPFRRREL